MSRRNYWEFEARKLENKELIEKADGMLQGVEQGNSETYAFFCDILVHEILNRLRNQHSLSTFDAQLAFEDFKSIASPQLIYEVEKYAARLEYENVLNDLKEAAKKYQQSIQTKIDALDQEIGAQETGIEELEKQLGSESHYTITLLSESLSYYQLSSEQTDMDDGEVERVTEEQNYDIPDQQSETTQNIDQYIHSVKQEMQAQVIAHLPTNKHYTGLSAKKELTFGVTLSVGDHYSESYHQTICCEGNWGKTKRDDEYENHNAGSNRIENVNFKENISFTNKTTKPTIEGNLPPTFVTLQSKKQALQKNQEKKERLCAKEKNITKLISRLDGKIKELQKDGNSFFTWNSEIYKQRAAELIDLKAMLENATSETDLNSTVQAWRNQDNMKINACRFAAFSGNAQGETSTSQWVDDNIVNPVTRVYGPG